MRQLFFFFFQQTTIRDSSPERLQSESRLSSAPSRGTVQGVRAGQVHTRCSMSLFARSRRGSRYDRCFDVAVSTFGTDVISTSGATHQQRTSTMQALRCWQVYACPMQVQPRRRYFPFHDGGSTADGPAATTSSGQTTRTTLQGLRHGSLFSRQHMSIHPPGSTVPLSAGSSARQALLGFRPRLVCA